ncbi:MAG: hypothetical protein Ct9H300mP15_27610 [Gemmatimonadota bacterium]|nr:MAG: hypothetical protein Ct9H300mP15_27610 [Gemmatimonadota bacterium]
MAVPASLELSDTLLTFLALGDTTQLSATVKDQNGYKMASATVTWVTSDTTVATVSDAGLVTSVSDGTATITATSGSGSAPATVTVSQVMSFCHTRTNEPVVVARIGGRHYHACSDSDGRKRQHNRESDSDVVVIEQRSRYGILSPGLVTSVADGTATITATSGSLTATPDCNGRSGVLPRSERRDGHMLACRCGPNGRSGGRCIHQAIESSDRRAC